ncbi:MAG TPA: GAF domain-containing protein, partial [Burkholderiaceae bacterium]|nr:GAF domain-containing protein [Burkholderiaceae bacterium]
VAPLGAALAPFIGKEAGEAAKLKTPAKTSNEPILVRHYRVNDSVFLGDEYLIKGVAGAIFARLVRDYAEKKRTEFSNRELRLDSAIRLPDITDNLEARLILLQRRLAERCDCMRIVKTGRGRFRLDVARDVKLIEVAE